MKIKLTILLSILFLLSCFTVACDKTSDYEGVEVSIVSTDIENRSAPYEPEYTKWVVIQYKVENIGTKPIRGWAVSFNVNFQIGSQLRTSHNIYCSVAPGNTSKIQSTSFLIPSNYHNAIGAVLINIEAW